MNEKEFKDEYRKNECTRCTKRTPCALADSICPLIVPCSVCDIKDSCTVICEQMTAYLNRGSKKEPAMVSFSADEEYISHKALQYQEAQETEETSRKKLTIEDVPWQTLSMLHKQILIGHFCEGQTYSELATKFGLAQSRIHSIIHGNKTNKGALKNLREHYKFQQLFLKHKEVIPAEFRKVLSQIYIEFKSILNVASDSAKTYRLLTKAKQLLLKREQQTKGV